jgi:predicted phage tail protein
MNTLRRLLATLMDGRTAGRKRVRPSRLRLERLGGEFLESRFALAADLTLGVDGITVTNAALVPGVPTAVRASVSGTTVSLSWAAPSSNGGAAITQYIVQWSTNGGATVASTRQTFSTSLATQLTNVPYGTTYVLRVAAANSVGWGAYSPWSNDVTAATVPGDATGLLATPGDGRVTVSWTPPTDNGGAAITDYTVQYALSTGNYTAFPDGTSTATSITVSGLTNGTTYRFRVLSTNRIGSSYSSVVSATPVAVPGPVRNPTISTGDSRVGLSWVAPLSDGGRAISDYAIQYALLGRPLAGDSNRDGLVDVLDISTLMSGGKFDSGLPASWEEGDFNADGVLDVLDVSELSAGGLFDKGDYVSLTAPSWKTLQRAASTATSATIPGLVNNSFYVVRVAATNQIGSGPWSTTLGPVMPVVPAMAPDAPTGVVASPGDTSATLSWTAPASNRSPITGYSIQYSNNGGSTWVTVPLTASVSTSASVVGLVNGSSYVFRVAAVNAIGTSPYSALSNAVVPIGVPTAPGMPTGVAATPGDAVAQLTWVAPASNGSPISDYTIQYSSNGGSTWTTFAHGASALTSATVAGLANGTTYVFRVAAVNGVGTSAFSLPSSPVTPAGITAPSAPGNVSGVAGDRSVSLTWTAPTSNGGSTITDYVIQYSSNNGTSWVTLSDGVSTVRSAVIAGLTNGTSYIFRVAASNSVGVGSYSAVTASLVPATVPFQGGNLTVAAGVVPSQVVLQWFAPTDNGGSPVTGYAFQSSIDGGTTWGPWPATLITPTASGSRLQYTVNGLSIGTQYWFRVAPINRVGMGNWITSVGITPLG